MGKTIKELVEDPTSDIVKQNDEELIIVEQPRLGLESEGQTGTIHTVQANIYGFKYKPDIRVTTQIVVYSLLEHIADIQRKYDEAWVEFYNKFNKL